MKLSKKQTIAIDYFEDKITNEIFYGGAAGGGKSFLGCYAILKNCLKYPGSRWLIGRKALKSLKETTLVSFFKVCNAQKIPQSALKYNAQSSQITFYNNSVILLKDLAYYPSDPNYDDLGSLEISGAFIDEAGQIRQECKDIVLSRCRHDLKKFNLIPKLIMASNPSKSWAYKQFFDAHRKNELPEFRQFIQALVTDNPDIAPEYIQVLKQISDEATRQRLLYGNWDYDDDPAQLISFQALQNSYTNNFIEPGEKHMTADIASEGSDRFVVVIWDGWRAEYFYSFTKLKANEIEETLKNLATKHKIPRSNIIYDADGLGTFLNGYLDGATAFHNGGKPIGRENYDNLKAQCNYYIAKKFNNSEIFINIPKNLKEDFEEECQAACKSYKADEDGKLRVVPKKLVKEQILRSPDIWDAIFIRAYADLTPDQSAFEF